MFIKKLRIAALCAAALLPFGFAFLDDATGHHSDLVEKLLNLACFAVAAYAMLALRIGRIFRTVVIVMIVGSLVYCRGYVSPVCISILVFALFLLDGDKVPPDELLRFAFMIAAASSISVILINAGAFDYLLQNRRMPDPKDGRVVEFMHKGLRLFLTRSEQRYATHARSIFVIARDALVIFGVLLPAADKIFLQRDPPRT